MDCAHALDPFRRADQANQPDLLCSALLEPIDGSDRRVRGGKNGDHHDDETLGEIRGRLEIILDRDQGLGLAIKTDMGDARGRDEVEHAVGEGEAPAQDRSKDELLAGDAVRRHTARAASRSPLRSTAGRA